MTGLRAFVAAVVVALTMTACTADMAITGADAPASTQPANAASPSTTPTPRPTSTARPTATPTPAPVLGSEPTGRTETAHVLRGIGSPDLANDWSEPSPGPASYDARVRQGDSIDVMVPVAQRRPVVAWSSPIRVEAEGPRAPSPRPE